MLGVLDELGLDRAVLAGYDVGSRVAQAAATLRPAAVRALVLSPPLPGVGGRILGPDAQREFWCQPGAFRASIAWYRAGAGAVAHSLRERPPAPDERIPIPTTVLWGDHEPLFPVAWSDRIGAFFADADVRVLPGVGPFAPLEAPRAAAEAVIERLRA
ncbi:MAG TPA: alpha/beta hydrolase [Solirubrobacteraceae bacterium]|nr:alpha/beta hydrolase [Solirubrobacteraceae bacterium]